MTRFTLMVAGTVAIGLTGCTSGRGRDPFFGETTPPAAQTLTFDNSSEPTSIDPAKALTLADVTIAGTLFEEMVHNHP